MSDLNINVNPEALDEKGERILTQARVIEEALQEIETAKNGLNSWQSTNKDKYDARINNALPKMREMKEAVASYGGVAKETARVIRNTEAAIINLTASDLTETARKIDEASNKIDRALQTLEREMSDMESVWKDANAQKYLERFNELREEFPEFKSAVRSYGTFLNSVVSTYEKEYNQNIAARVGRTN